ncbi:hypothetical protein [Frondihabitans sp. VKM Ac-2883]|uniref:phosphoketolase family protein n=1 Tax=Frondihabitans sp. VKM Ac-2883 TaxID=2783823 RepID=UPI00188BFBCF|nr:hypothetical protein [Frondihabitans sp. VKM Ac-2883]MBF4577915.1 hypothetical protein [Frondihabitans sp. VKM Ac-2883]
MTTTSAVETVDAWWRAANYLTVSQIYLMDDPLLQEPLAPERIKPRLLGHWGTSPALNFVYAHLNRVRVRDGRQMIYVCGPGHGGPAMVANAWLGGTYSELVPDVTRDKAGMQRLFRQFSFPGGIPSHDAPNVPGSINEGGELGYSLADIEWRRPISPFVYLLSSHVWCQDHNGFSHQDPGFLDVVVNKQAHVVRISLAPDTNTLLAVMDKGLRDVDTVQVVVTGKQEQPAWLSIDEAEEHVRLGAGIWDWAGTPGSADRDDPLPDVILACAGDVPTLETVAAADIIRRSFPEVAVRVVNVVDLMKLQDQREHPHGFTDDQFDALFTTDRPVVFDFHGYPSLVHQLTYRRHGHDNIHVRGFQEKDTTTTPFDMAMLNDIDRYKLVLDVLEYVPGLSSRHPDAAAEFVSLRAEARAYAYEHGEDHPDVTG